jgi:hypothetical protein
MSEQEIKKYARGLTPEEKEERRKHQLRVAQLKFRESHGLVKPKLTDEEKKLRRKDKAKMRYQEKRQQQEKADRVPSSYSVEYQRTYHRTYYENNKDKLLEKSRERYSKKAQDAIKVYSNAEDI